MMVNWNVMGKSTDFLFAMLCCVQLCLTLCNPLGCSLSGSSVSGVFQARILKWAAISFFKGSSRARDWTHISCVFCIGRWIIYLCATWEAHRGKIHLCLYTNRQSSCWQNVLRNTQICLGILEKWGLFLTFQVARWKTSSTLSHVQLFPTPWTVTCQHVILQAGYWIGLPFSSPGKSTIWPSNLTSGLIP